MKEIHLGRVLSENRRRKGVTQDELAEFMGVSKAAVSKWETESTNPDILLLPRLAAYFDMSIDELMVMNRRWTEKRSGRHTGCFQRSLPRILLRRLWSTAENTPGSIIPVIRWCFRSAP